MTREEKNSYRIPYTTLRIHRSDCSYNKIKQPSPTPEPPPPPSPKQSPTPQGVTVKPLSSKIEVISWTTPAPMFASVEYKTSPFVSTNKEGAFFPSKSLSLNAPYTRVLSTRQDLCPTDLSANTLYYARLWIKDAGGMKKSRLNLLSNAVISRACLYVLKELVWPPALRRVAQFG